jgi:hypothetical protein
VRHVRHVRHGRSAWRRRRINSSRGLEGGTAAKDSYSTPQLENKNLKSDPRFEIRGGVRETLEAAPVPKPSGELFRLGGMRNNSLKELGSFYPALLPCGEFFCRGDSKIKGTGMTKSKGVGRGGKRAGAGRKRAVVAHVEMGDFKGSIADLKSVALATLEDVLRNSKRDACRVSAARIVLARAEQEAKDIGKKGAALAVAQQRAQEGKFAPPPPPGSKMN